MSATPRKIYCSVCDKYVGEIRDATLIKGLKYICSSCDNEDVQIKDDFYHSASPNKSDFTSIFNDIFKNKYKK
jgi:hypothetical protein